MAASNLFPEDLVVQIRKRGPAVQAWHQTRFLLVDVGSEPSELMTTLISSSVAHRDVEPISDGIQFSTSTTPIPSDTKPRTLLTSKDLLQRLQTTSYFIAPLRKRVGENTASITVGRARNNDLVLRHASVSKLHAWIEIDAQGDFWVSDAGSTNHTAVDGQALTQNATRRIDEGYEIKFGKVGCVLVSSTTVWEVANRITMRPTT